MKWVLNEPQSGDMIRVLSGSIYHYGIYVSDSEVIQFGLPPAARPTVKDSEIRVIATDIETFMQGGLPEVAEFDRKEKRKNRPPALVVDYARSRIGSDGYHILYNNCEHFAYECVTGKPYSSQVDDVREQIRGMMGKQKPKE